MLTTDYTKKKASTKGKYRICPTCGKVGSFEPHGFKDREAWKRGETVYIYHDYYVHKATLLNIGGIRMRSLDESCSVRRNA